MDPAKEFLSAVQSRDAPRARALLDADPGLARARGPDGTSALLLACYAGAGEVAETLLARGARPDVFEAAALGRIERVRELVKADPELLAAHSADGWTPLHLAAHFGWREVVESLLHQGADVRARSRNGEANTPLHAAIAGQSREVAALLLEHGADPDAPGGGGYTPLHIAASGGRVELVEMLLARGASLKAEAEDGRTPLAVAVERRHAPVVQLLRARGAPA